jgi:hypothetical protein
MTTSAVNENRRPPLTDLGDAIDLDDPLLELAGLVDVGAAQN